MRRSASKRKSLRETPTGQADPVGRSTVDTTILADLQKGVPYAREVLEEVVTESGGLILTAPVFAEVMTAVFRARPSVKADEVVALAENSTVLPFDMAAARMFAEEISRLSRDGQRPRLMDALIASVALAHNLTIVSRERRDFHMFTGLALRLPPGSRDADG